jgi:hypothetical protein
MKKTYTLMLVGALALVPAARAVDRVVTTESPTGPGSLTEAINALQDGDRITFNISPGTPSAVHYIPTPVDAYPVITKNNITIDGYSQPGASPNTASIHEANNAALKIVLTSTNGNAMSMDTSLSASWGVPAGSVDWGYGDDEQAILAFFHATNVTVKGLVIIGPHDTASSVTAGTLKSICFAAVPKGLGGYKCENWHISGCWWGVNPVTKQLTYMPDGVTPAVPRICIASYRARNTPGGSEPDWNYNWPGTIGVAAGSSNPRAEFNIMLGSLGFDSEGRDFRASGNFWGVLPDGVTSVDISAIGTPDDGYFECGRNNSNIIFGTDGDGVNDDQEGNICGPINGAVKDFMDIYSPNAGTGTNQIIAGNNFNADINGKCFGPSLGIVCHTIRNTATVRFGSDFNGVSDDVERNIVFNGSLFDFDNAWPTNTFWLSMRGNSMTNVNELNTRIPPFGDGQAPTMGQNVYSAFIDVSGAGGTLDIIPVITSASATSLSGTCGKPLAAPYNKVMIDLYQADTSIPTIQQGKKWLAAYTENSTSDSNPAVGAFTVSTAGLGLQSGSQITLAATYVNEASATIKSITRNGNTTTLVIDNPNGGRYGIFASSTVNGTYAPVATTDASGVATFTSGGAAAFYRVTTPLAQGQTSPFAVTYVIP